MVAVSSSLGSVRPAMPVPSELPPAPENRSASPACTADRRPQRRPERGTWQLQFGPMRFGAVLLDVGHKPGDPAGQPFRVAVLQPVPGGHGVLAGMLHPALGVG